MSSSSLNAAELNALAESHFVCVRPVFARVTDGESGVQRTVAIACGSTLEESCAPCATKARRLRMAQCREGWHLMEEPPENESDDESDEPATSDPDRRHRSTRRRQDVPDLPRMRMEDRTVGNLIRAANGKTYRPSMFLTVTLPSYGPVHSDGTPRFPATYDYRRAALDALTFSDLYDRLVQNLRRCAGFKLQYFAAVEPQRRLAPHLHAAIRGVMPRQVIREVVAATYFQLWWPPLTEVDFVPTWNDSLQAFMKPGTDEALPTWDQALDRIDQDDAAEPVHVARFGRQLDMQGVLAGSGDSNRRIGYLTKYLAKSMTQPLDSPGEPSERQRAHVDRLHSQLRVLPCSPGCANWLKYGVQPVEANRQMIPGQCRRKAHRRSHLGYGGRRVLVSRKWTGKTLTEHRADRAAVVRAALEAAGVEMDDHHELAIAPDQATEASRFSWTILSHREVDPFTRTRVMLTTIRQRARWRQQYERVRHQQDQHRQNHRAPEVSRHGEAAHR